MEEIINGLPNICGREKEIGEATRQSGPVFLQTTNISLDRINAAFGIALHMHQPTIPAGGDDLAVAALINNLDYMMNHPDIGDNHNAPVFAWCYSRMGDFIPELIDKGKNPRVMLDYSGNLLWGLRQMEWGDILDHLKKITCDPYNRYVEWLGTMWSHAVVASTPVPDVILHIKAWQHHFASIFGLDFGAHYKPPYKSRGDLFLGPAHKVEDRGIKPLDLFGVGLIQVERHDLDVAFVDFI